MAVIVAENMDGKLDAVAQDIKDLKVYFSINAKRTIFTLDQDRRTAAGSEYVLSSYTCSTAD
jgi:hypothetical protein